MNRLLCDILAVRSAAIQLIALFTISTTLLTTEALSLSAQIQPEIAVEPRRLVLEGTAKSGEIHVRSSAPDTLVYALVMVNYRMSEMGEFIETASPLPGQLFADKMIQITPKELTILPQGEATIKVLCNRPIDLADGEYRSHLALRFIRRAGPAAPASQSIPQKGGGEGEKSPPIAVSLDYDISIPIIIRQGSLSAKVTISYVNVDLATTGADSTSLPGEPFATTRFERTGTRSTYGDVTLWFIGEEGHRTQLGELRNIALYTPNPLRRLRIPLKIPPGLLLTKGQLRIEYKEGDAVVIGELEVPLP